MRTVDMEEAKAQLPKLFEEALNGEPFIVAEDGKPRLEVTVKAIVEQKTPTLPRIGFLEGQFSIPDNFDTMADEEMEEMMRMIEEKEF